MSNKLGQKMIGSGRTDRDRNLNDFYPTPPFVVNALCRNFHIPKTIWEPAAGRGHISKELERNNHEVISSDLIEYDNPLVHVKTSMDFLTCKIPDVNAVITNPPYEKKLPMKLALRCIQEKIPFTALLCRLLFLESEGRYSDLFSKHRPTDVLVLSGRFSCDEDKFDTDPTGGMVSYAWFVWDYYNNIPNEVTITNLNWCSVNKEYEIWKKETNSNISYWIE